MQTNLRQKACPHLLVTVVRWEQQGRDYEGSEEAVGGDWICLSS